jgi:HEAT repeat protein
MRLLSLTLSVAFVAACLAAEQKLAPAPQGKEPSYQGKTLSQWAALAKDKDSPVKGEAAAALGKMGAEGAAALVELLKDNDDAVRGHAAWALGYVPAAVPALTDLLTHRDRRVRQAATQALGYNGPAAKTAVPALTELLKDSDAELRDAAAEALGHVGPAAKSAAPALMELLNDNAPRLREAAASALGTTGRGVEGAVPAVIAALKDENSGVREHAAQALFEMGSKELAAVPLLIGLLGDESADVRSSTADALGTIGPQAKAAVPALTRALDDKDRRVRRQAASALAHMGCEAEPAVPALIKLLEDESSAARQDTANPRGRQQRREGEWTARGAAALALGSIGPPAEAAVPALTELLRDKTADVRYSAAWALGGIGPRAKPAVPALIELLRSDEMPQGFAARALGKIGAEARDAVPALTQLLKGGTPGIRPVAAQALGNMGPDAKAAVPALTELLKDKDPLLRLTVRDALEQITPALPPAPKGQAWRLVWHDEFGDLERNERAAGMPPDDRKWEVMPDAPRKDGWWMRKAVSLDGQGHLAICTLKEGDRYIDGCVRTRGKFEHAFGYYVARIQLQKQPGHWPAFWIMGPGAAKAGADGRDGTEIDIMEKPWLDERVQHTLHWGGYGKQHKFEGKVVKVPGIMEGWHTFGLWWKPDEYVFYVDGKETWRTRAGGVCQVPEYIKLSDEIGSWGGDIRKAHPPDQFLVDYVRVYDLVADPGTAGKPAR